MPRWGPATPTAPAGCSATTRSLRTWRCGPSCAARRPSCATCGAPCPACPTPGPRSGTWPAPARAADTNGADGQPVAVGAAALEVSRDGKITKVTAVGDGSLLDDRAITALAAGAVDR